MIHVIYCTILKIYTTHIHCFIHYYYTIIILLYIRCGQATHADGRIHLLRHHHYSFLSLYRYIYDPLRYASISPYFTLIFGLFSLSTATVVPITEASINALSKPLSLKYVISALISSYFCLISLLNFRLFSAHLCLILGQVFGIYSGLRV